MEWTFRGNSDSFGARGSREHGGTHGLVCKDGPSITGGAACRHRRPGLGAQFFFIFATAVIFILCLGYKIIKPYVVL